VDVACHADFQPIALAAAKSVPLRITLYIGLQGMGEMKSHEYTFGKPLRYRLTSPFSPGDPGDAETGELVLTYENLP
jgi:hypothetical protein